MNSKKNPLECTKGSTRMYKKVHYYSLLDQRYCIIIIQISIRGSDQVLLGHACSVHNYTKEGPLFVPNILAITLIFCGIW